MTAMVETRHGDMLDVLAAMDAASVDSIVTDPPYGLAFMGRSWDHGVPCPDYWTACLRVLRPGGHLLAFGGTRTAHRLACAIEDAGFEIRDTITWHYGSGFPKSHDVSKHIDRMLGAERATKTVPTAKYTSLNRHKVEHGGQATHWQADAYANRHEAPTVEVNGDEPATDAARQWQGWGTALKPASEPIIVARKPLAGTVAATVLAHGTGALNIDATRVEGAITSWPAVRNSPTTIGNAGGRSPDSMPGRITDASPAGRWPTNVVFSHAPDCAAEGCGEECAPGCPVAELDAQSGTLTSGGAKTGAGGLGGRGIFSASDQGYTSDDRQRYDSGGASRFFPTFRYQAKAPSKERPKVDGVAHPTVKPLALMRWLVRLVTPPGGLVLDPFAGSGTTGEAAALEGMRAVLVEREEAYLPLIAARLGRVPA